MSSDRHESVPEPMPTARELIASIVARLPGLNNTAATRNAEAAIRQDQRRRQEWTEARLLTMRAEDTEASNLPDPSSAG